MMIQVQTFTFNTFQENTYILFDESREAVIIDPGCFEKEEQEELKEFIATKNLEVKFLLNTHCHIDHVLGNYFVKALYKVPLLVHLTEIPILKSVMSYASNYGFPGYTEAVPDGELIEGNQVRFGFSSLDILFVPGHSPGHVAFYNSQQQFLIAGDVLFKRSIGRTDLPGGNMETLLSSIHHTLYVLPDEVTVHPGHGPVTTLGEEKLHNPFCALPV